MSAEDEVAGAVGVFGEGIESVAIIVDSFVSGAEGGGVAAAGASGGINAGAPIDSVIMIGI